MFKWRMILSENAHEKSGYGQCLRPIYDTKTKGR